ncbi:MAG: hypothetical protein ACM3N4_05660 [Nitrososphaerota archaeon]
MNLSLHPTRFPVTLEKWYIDTLLDDGSILLVYLGTLTLFRVRLARVTVELFLPQGQVVRGSATARHIMGGEGILYFGPATIVGDRLRFTTAGLSGDLVYHPRQPPCALREPFLVAGDRTLHWVVEMPDADVIGRLAWPGGSRTVTGRGYRDRVWFDIPPWRFPIRELIWGRAAAGAHAATWVRATTGQGIIAASWLDGHVVATEDSSVPPSDVALGPGQVFLDADVAALEGLRLGALRGLLRRLSRDPHETKWRAPCMIAGVEGIAVHEVARWHV